MALVARNARLSMALAAEFGRRLRRSERRRIECATGDTGRRLAAGLLELSERFGRPTDAGVVIELPLSQEELATFVGASHKSVTTALRRLRELDCVGTARRSITVRDPAALLRLCA
jgi:CRP-like cAMP-binding protein